MTQFKDLNEFFDPGLVLPVGGVEYAIQPPSATYGLWLQQMVVTGQALQHEDDTDAIIERVTALGTPPDGKTIPEIVLGDAYSQMQANGVDLMRIKHCVNTALIWIVMGEEAAAHYWANPGGGEPGKASNRAERRRTSKGTGGARKTRKRGSSSGTSSRKT
ncbi:DUF7426 family protein [Dactylosporangium salmoneum]|uniref:DUF7426 domain-containing protein n=1 Tax=Dactylosporangium salmoneum TaxID=53361 RepID=A0ABP5SCI6_9ACTN